MRPFILTSALILVPGIAVAQGAWGKIKSWTGTITVELTKTQKQDRNVGTLTYKATGGFTISDDAMPDGDHMQWPMPDPEKMTDPALLQAARNPWKSRVVATYHFTGFNESNNAVTDDCTADEAVAARFGVTSSPTAETFVATVEVPLPKFKCTSGSDGGSILSLAQTDFQLTGPRGQPGKVTATKTFTIDPIVIKITLEMAPTK